MKKTKWTSLKSFQEILKAKRHGGRNVFLQMQIRLILLIAHFVKIRDLFLLLTLRHNIINIQRSLMKMFIKQNIKISKRSKMMIENFLRIEIMEPQNLFGMKKLKKAKNLWVC